MRLPVQNNNHFIAIIYALTISRKNTQSGIPIIIIITILLFSYASDTAGYCTLLE